VGDGHTERVDGSPPGGRDPIWSPEGVSESEPHGPIGHPAAAITLAAQVSGAQTGLAVGAAAERVATAATVNLAAHVRAGRAELAVGAVAQRPATATRWSAPAATAPTAHHADPDSGIRG
jgi:hypothetical protein